MFYNLTYFSPFTLKLMSNKNTINSWQIKPIQQKDAVVSDFHINTRTHLQVYKPGQSHKNPSNTFDCHKLAAA